MTQDVNAAVKALFTAGVKRVTIKDFHRTGYNLLREHLDQRAQLISGYKTGPVPGIGTPDSNAAALFLGMHAATGTPGFLAHTLTSAFTHLAVNHQAVTELALFAASLAPYDIWPAFFSGCPVACRQAAAAIPGISTFAIAKPAIQRSFDPVFWRRAMARGAVHAITRERRPPFSMKGPFHAVIRLKKPGAVTDAMALKWGLEIRGQEIHFDAETFAQLYGQLLRIAYLTPWREKWLRGALFANNCIGRAGLAWVRRHLRSGLRGRLCIPLPFMLF
jgi:D-aminopeptidase